jgi:hypothetical protein
MPSTERVRSLLAASFLLSAGCGFDRSDRWLATEQPAPECALGDRRCAGTLQECVAHAAGPRWQVIDDCPSQGRVCAASRLACTLCQPRTSRCGGQTVLACDDTGDVESEVTTCDTTQDVACREGACVNLCAVAAERRSNVGCEYWAADLDNAVVDQTLNAAAQQFAVVVSNPQPDLRATVTVELDDSAPGGTSNMPTVVQELTLPPLSLHTFKLGPREVDGSKPGEFDTGTGTALTRAAFRIKSSVPVVAYQFNPLENVNVFSNDASLLKPVEALSGTPGQLTESYVVLGWPQTIAATSDPSTNFDPADPTALRAFLTIVGTRPGTRVRVDSSARILGGGPVASTEPGGTVEMTLEPFDVLNLETNDFNADFSGSLVYADQPVVVFSGSEASDAPLFETLAERQCCADHLEEQLDPIRTAGTRFVASVTPNRSEAVVRAGSTIGTVPQPEYFRVIAVTPRGARVRTTLPGANASVMLPARGSYAQLESTSDFMLESDEPIMLASVSPSQEAAGIPRGLPGGDPSFVIVPPIEQYRSSYVFLTPDKYNFDFIRVIAPAGATILLDGVALETLGCSRAAADGLSDAQRNGAPPELFVHRCQLSFPRITPAADDPTQRLAPGLQNDGVHRLESNRAIGLLVDGFDAFVSYGYAGGTQLEQIVPPE